MPIKLLEEKDILPLINKREGEQKIGENIRLGSQLSMEELQDLDTEFVVFGVPEDVGPRANLGKVGAESGWEHFLSAFLNVQENDYFSSRSILLFGIIDFRDHPNYHSKEIDLLRQLVSEIDQEVSGLVETIIKAGKTPILIGGGHNNAYGLLKGCSKALGKTINCINLDPHADFRALEGRHSGNGFSYAKKEGYLNKYYLCGLHQSYNSQSMINALNEDTDIAFSTFDGCLIQSRSTFKESLKSGLKHVSDSPYGVELDCDSIQQFPVSAKTASGISSNQARMYTYQMGANKNALYYHLAEAAPSLDEKNAAVWGKLMSYLVTDFMKAKSSML